MTCCTVPNIPIFDFIDLKVFVFILRVKSLLSVNPEEKGICFKTKVSISLNICIRALDKAYLQAAVQTQYDLGPFSLLWPYSCTGKREEEFYRRRAEFKW